MLRWGILGPGMIAGRALAPAMRAAGHDLAVVGSRSLSRAQAFAASQGVRRARGSYEEVLEAADVDAVYIALPNDLHEPWAVAALEAGKHVLCEKPLANSVEEAEAMTRAAASARERGVRSMVGFNYRRIPALALARDLLASGRLGAVREVRLSYLQDWLADSGAPMTWRLRRESAGSGALGDLGSHAVDQLRFLTGHEVDSLSATTRTFVTHRDGPEGSEPVTVDDAAWATMTTDGGAVCSLEVSRVASGRKNALGVEVYGELGSLSFDLERLNELQVHESRGLGGRRTVLVTEADHPYLSAWWPPGHVLGWEHTFTHQAADLLTAVAAGEDPAPSFADGLAVQRVLSAIQESATTGRRVSLAGAAGEPRHPAALHS